MTKIQCKNGESVYFLKDFYKTEHWSKLKLDYINSDLSKICFKCKSTCNPIHFLHRTKKRMGNEKLTDLLPVCSLCLNSKPEKSKKKNERRILAAFGFNANRLTDGQKQWFYSIKPSLRGYFISKYFSQKASAYKPSKQWINSQVKKTCKWIKQQEKLV